MVAAGQKQSGFASVTEAATAMAAVPEREKQLVKPRRELTSEYDQLYQKYRQLADSMLKL